MFLRLFAISCRFRLINQTEPSLKNFKECFANFQTRRVKILNYYLKRSLYRSCNESSTIGKSIGGVTLCFSFFGLFGEDMPVEEEILLHIKKAILAMERDELDVAEVELVKAFFMSKKHGFGEALTQVVSYQADLAIRKKKLSDAERLLKFLTQRLINVHQATPTDNSFIEVSLKIAEIYAQTGRTNEAISGFQHCVVTQKSKIESGQDDEDTVMLGAWSLNHLAQMYLRLSKPGKTDDIHLTMAVSFLREALAYVVKIHGFEAQQAVAIQTDLGTALSLQGQYDAALKIFEQIGTIAREKHSDLYPTIRISIANIHLQKSEYDEAMKICIEAKDFASNSKDNEAFHRAEECIRTSLREREQRNEAMRKNQARGLNQ